MKKFVGVDLHKQRIVVCVVNQARQVLTSARFTNAESIKLAAWLKALGSFDLVLEATASYEWFVKLVEPLAGRVLLAHPRKMRIIAESTRKSDKVDARVLAEFLALDMIPPAHRPTPRQQAPQAGAAAGLRTGAADVDQEPHPARGGRVQRGPQGSVHEREPEVPAGLKLDPVDRWLVQRLLRELKLYRDELKAVDRQLAAFARTAPAAEAGHRALLDSIPAVGPVTRETFLAEVAGPERFGSQKKLTSYVGLAPGQRESAGRRHDLGITHSGSPILRWVLHQAAWQLVRRLVALATDLRAAGPAPRKEEGHYRHRAEAAVSDAGRHPQRTAVPERP
ncbi:MAG: IS110 family transposase [Phycisphaerales bacterium]|nr:IS110 family transposase [Phycisphaerales bacterium]